MRAIFKRLAGINNQSYSITLLLLGIILVSSKFLQISRLCPITSQWLLGSIVTIITALTVRYNRLRLNRWIIILVVISFISLLINVPDSAFHTWERLGYFAASLALLSPLCENKRIACFRCLLWKILLCAVYLLVEISAIIWAYSFITGDSEKIFLFRGLTPNGMTLAPLCGFIIIHLLSCVCTPKMPSWRKTILAVDAAIIFMMMVSASSRIALVALAIGVIPLAFTNRAFILRHKRHLLWIPAFVAIIVFSPNLSRGIATKMQYATLNNSMSYSRDAKWQNRWDEFIQSPVIGIGYTNQNEFNTTLDNYDYVMASGHTEPGSSWLGILAQIGLAGFAAIIIFSYAIFSRLLRKIQTRTPGNWSLYLSWICFFWIHGIAEGWMLYPGAMVFFVYWLLTGVISATYTYGVGISDPLIWIGGFYKP